MEKKSNEMYVYSVYSKVSKKYNGLFYHYTDEEMIQKSLPIVLMDFALRDIEVFRIAIFNDDSAKCTPLEKLEKVNTNCYLFPHYRLSPEGEDLPLEKIEENMKKKKNAMIVKANNDIEDYKENEKKENK